MSPTKSKPYKLKSLKMSPGNMTSDAANSIRRRPRTQQNSEDLDFEELRKSIKLSASSKSAFSLNNEQKPWHPIIKVLLDLEEDPSADLRIFPRFAIWFLMLLTFWSRYLIVNGSEGMALIHPQEQFPTIESAHIAVYGYGLKINETSFIDPLVSEENQLPTPWIHRQIYATLFRVKQRFGITTPPFLLARAFHAAIAALTPWCVYHFTRTLFGQCRDVAFMSANLVAFSKHLIIYGIHPFSQNLLSPLTFIAMTALYKIWTAKNSVVRSSTLLLCGLIFGIVIYIQADSFPLLVVIFLIISPSSISHKLHYLPFSLRLTSLFTVLIGAILGLQFGIAQDRIHYRFWFITPLELTKIRVANNPNFAYTWMNFRSFLSANHVHWALVIAALVCSLIYLSYKQKWTELFDTWLNSANQEILFKVTAKLTLTSSILMLCSIYPHQLWCVHDLLILVLISGSASIYLLYRGLYIYIMSVAKPHRTTKNIIKLIVYGELFLYMFESRITFPSSSNQSISSWSHKETWESAPVNWCLSYVSNQPDISGVFIDYPVEMTAGYSLLHHKVPMISVVGNEFWEWDPANQVVSNIYSLQNSPQLITYAVNNHKYNYFIITGGRKFFNHGFRKVYNATNVRVFKRSKSFTERQRLDEALAKLTVPRENDIWIKEAASLVSFGLYEKAVERLKLVLQRDETNLKAWQLLNYAVKQTELNEDEVLSKCLSTFGSICKEEIDVNAVIAKDSQWNVTYRFI